MISSRYYFYTLGVKHPLPQPVSEYAGQSTAAPIYFHSVIPVGICLYSTRLIETSIQLKLLDCPDAFFYKILFTHTPPIDRYAFLEMLDLIGQVSALCCYKVEIVDAERDGSEFFKQKCDDLKINHINVSRRLYLETYGRN